MKFLFDLGGVFFDWDPDFFYKKIIKKDDERNMFLSKICNNEWNIKQDKGRLIIDAENELIAKFPKYSYEIKLYYKNHRKMFKKIFSQSVKVLEFLKSKNIECYVLSNWSWETFQNMEKEYPFLNLFDGLIISGKEQMIKPDKEIYLLAINRFNLDPEQTVFIDDKIENIEAAKKLNFKTIHLDKPELIRDKIKFYI